MIYLYIKILLYIQSFKVMVFCIYFLSLRIVLPSKDSFFSAELRKLDILVSTFGSQEQPTKLGVFFKK